MTQWTFIVVISLDTIKGRRCFKSMFLSFMSIVKWSASISDVPLGDQGVIRSHCSASIKGVLRGDQGFLEIPLQKLIRELY